MFLYHKPLRKNEKYLWTNHVLQKMAFYRLSESRIKRVLRNTKRTEEGIAPDTVASMQRNDTKKRKEEIWVMYQVNKKSKMNKFAASDRKKQKLGKIIIISAWRYPGVSPTGKKIPIPEDILEDLRSNGLIG